MADKNDREKINKAVKAAMESGLIDKKISIEDVLSKMGDDFDPAAGYVVAWDKYVAVIADKIPELKVTR